MKAIKLVAAVTWAGVLGAGCGDPGLGVDLTGLWIAQSYEYRNSAGQTVDLVSRDGASMSMTVDFRSDGTRRASVLFNDGQGNSVNLTGDVNIEAGTFTFPDVTYTFTRSGTVLTLTDPTSSFDFGSGPESATLNIRLTQL